MQLGDDDVKSALLAASCALLGTTAAAEDWAYDTAFMYYGEPDRVTAYEGIALITYTPEEEEALVIKLVYDSLTGASPSGAVPQSSPQTFTTPSGNATYDIDSNAPTLDDTFLDTRYQLAMQWQQPLTENLFGGVGFNYSTEHDYKSSSFNIMLGHYFNFKNTTLTLGISQADDVLDPVGGIPIGLATMVVDEGQFANEQAYRDAFNATRLPGIETEKTTTDIVIGVTQVIDRRWLTQLNLSFSQVDGYQTDPYKLISQVDNTGLAVSYHYEARPETRDKQAIFLQSKYHFDGAIWDMNYRLADDSWGIASHTIDTRYRFLLEGSRYIEPHLRLYRQSAADFYQTFLLSSQALPSFASADYRVGKLATYTLGVRYGMMLEGDREFGFRVEYYQQSPQASGAPAPGDLAGLELYPDYDAYIFQIDYDF